MGIGACLPYRITPRHRERFFARYQSIKKKYPIYRAILTWGTYYYLFNSISRQLTIYAHGTFVAGYPRLAQAQYLAGSFSDRYIMLGICLLPSDSILPSFTLATLYAVYVGQPIQWDYGWRSNSQTENSLNIVRFALRSIQLLR